MSYLIGEWPLACLIRLVIALLVMWVETWPTKLEMAARSVLLCYAQSTDQASSHSHWNRSGFTYWIKHWFSGLQAQSRHEKMSANWKLGISNAYPVFVAKSIIYINFVHLKEKFLTISYNLDIYNLIISFNCNQISSLQDMPTTFSQMSANQVRKVDRFSHGKIFFIVS